MFYMEFLERQMQGANYALKQLSEIIFMVTCSSILVEIYHQSRKRYLSPYYQFNDYSMLLM